jgi:uncharacterized protein (DUF433 family)
MKALALPQYLEADDRGVPWIAGTNTKVAEVVLDHLEAGWSPERIHDEYPELSLAQIHAALAYYFDHREQIDTWIAESRAEMEAYFAHNGPSPVAARLRRTFPGHE